MHGGQYPTQAGFNLGAIPNGLALAAPTLQQAAFSPVGLAMPASADLSAILAAVSAPAVTAGSSLVGGVPGGVCGGVPTPGFASVVPAQHSQPISGNVLPEDPLAALQKANVHLQRKAEEQAVAKKEQVKEEARKKQAGKIEEGERRRCHLHKRHQDKCKFCQRYKEFADSNKEEKAALRDKFVSDVRSKMQGNAKEGGEAVGDFRSGTLELVNTKTFGLPPLLQMHILQSSHYKTVMTMEHLEDITEEIFKYVDNIEPYAQGSSASPSAFFCCLYRLFTMGLETSQLRKVVEHEDSPYIRCAGFLFIRFGLSPEQLWPWMSEYVLDDQELQPSKDTDVTTIGEYVEGLLTQERYFNTVLPRLPVSTKRQLEAQLAQVPQFRKRTKANQRLLEVYCQRGASVEVCLGDGRNHSDWCPGEALELIEANRSRPKLKTRLDSGKEVIAHLGKVILTDTRYASAGSSGSREGGSRGGGRRSRSRSPAGGLAIDWARQKGRSGAELLEDMKRKEQDRAVCSSGKEYCRRPVSFQVALPIEQGSASTKLIQEETFVQSHSGSKNRAEGSIVAEPGRAKEHTREYQARMQKVHEKYGTSSRSGQEGGSRADPDIDRPDVMRLG